MAVTTDLVVAPHPLTAEGQRVHVGLVLDPAETLASLLQRHEVVAGNGWEVSISGAVVPEVMWQRTRVRHGQLIEVRQRAGQDVAKAVAILAIAYFTMGAGLAVGGLGAYMGVTGFMAFAINAGAFMLGAALVNRLLPATRPQMGTYQSQSGTTYSLSGSRNRARPYEPLGLLLGRVRVTPDLAAQPYAWFAGDEQFQYLVLHAGINCASVDQLKVGDTLLSSYDDVVVSLAGFPDGTTALQQWASVDTVAGGALEATTSPGEWVIRTSSPNTVRLAVDIAAQLYSMDDNGNVQNETVRLEAEYRQLPSGGWSPLVPPIVGTGGATVFGFTINSGAIAGTSAFEVTHGATKLHRGTRDLAVPAGQYEVRMRKVTVDSTDTRRQNTVEWVALKSYQPDPANYAGQPRVGVRIKASGQLNGSLDQLNWMAQSAPCPLWDGSAWSTVANSNPGALFLQLARGIYAPGSGGRLLAGLGLADAQIDIEGLQAFMVHCTSRGYTFNHWFDAAMSCGDMLDAIAAAGLGVKTYNSGKLGVAWIDESQPMTGVLSPVRMAARSFAVEYATGELAEEVEVSWPDSEGGTWMAKSLRVPVPSLSGTPRDTARQAPIGVTTQAGALLAARLAMAQNVWQRKSISWQMDLEHLDFRRYSVIALSHDLTQWGYSGRLVAAMDVAGTVTLQLDEEVPAGTSARYIGLQLPDETGYRVFTVAAFTGTTRSVTLVGEWPAGMALPGGAGNPAHDTVWIYDFCAAPGQRLLVTGVEPAADMKGARITAVPLPDAFWTFVRSGGYTAMPAPVAAQPVVASNIRVLQQRLDVTYDDTTELAITWDAMGPYDHAQVLGARVGEALVVLGETRTTRWPSWRVRNDGQYRIVIRPYDALGRVGQYAEATHTVTLTAFETGARTYRQEAAPGSPRAGDIWTKPSTGEQRRWSGAGWELVATVGANASNFTGQIGGGNLVGNSGFQLHDGALPDGWRVYNNANVSVTTIVAPGGMFGTNFVRLTVGATPPSTCGIYVRDNAHQVKTWVPGQTYVVSLWVRAGNTAAVGRKVWPLYSNMGFFSEYEIESPTMVEGSWRRVAVRCSPNNHVEHTAAGELFISVLDSTLPAGAAYDICAVQVEMGEIPTAWAPSARDKLGIDNPLTDSNKALIGYLGDLNASADIRLTTRGTVLNGNKLSKPLGTVDGWDSDAYSLDSYAGGVYAIAAATAGDKNIIFGLNSDPASSTDYTSLDYVWNLANNAECLCGSWALGWISAGGYGAGTQFAVTYDGTTVRWIKDGQVRRTLVTADVNNLYFDCSFASPGGSLAGCRFGPLSSNNWAAVGGTGKPQDNATVGAPAGTYVGTTEAAALATQASAAYDNAQAAQSQLTTMRSNGYIDAAEKPALIKEWTAIALAHDDLLARSGALGIDTERTAYANAKEALAVYLSNLSPAWNNTTTDTPITPAVDQSYWTDLYTKRQVLMAKMAQVAATLATWAGVSGAGKPADGATKNEVTYSATAPASPSSGDLWCDIGVTPHVWRLRLGGAWQAAASYVTDTSQISDGAQLGLTAAWAGVTGLGKPADGATINRLTYSASAPGGPVDGDIWVDTSASPATIRLRTGGVWVDGANLSTGELAQLNVVDTAQIAGGAATDIYTDVYDYGGASFGSRTVNYTPTANCIIEFTAKVVAGGVYGDGARHLGWYVSVGGGSYVLLDGAASSNPAWAEYSGVAAFAATAGVTLTFKLEASVPPGDPAIVLKATTMRIEAVKR